MKQEQNSFSRLWTYLRAYRLEVCLSIFLKILSVVMSVVEPFVLGLAITELTKNLMDMAKGLAGAGLNTSYIAIIMTPVSYTHLSTSNVLNEELSMSMKSIRSLRRVKMFLSHVTFLVKGYNKPS